MSQFVRKYHHNSKTHYSTHSAYSDKWKQKSKSLIWFTRSGITIGKKGLSVVLKPRWWWEKLHSGSSSALFSRSIFSYSLQMQDQTFICFPYTELQTSARLSSLTLSLTGIVCLYRFSDYRLKRHLTHYPGWYRKIIRFFALVIDHGSFIAVDAYPAFGYLERRYPAP